MYITIQGGYHLINMVAFDPECLYCKGKPSLDTYSCECEDKDWTVEYRTIEISLKEEGLKDLIRSSYQAYDLASPKGIFQYKGLPNISGKEELNEKVGGTDLIKLPNFTGDSEFNVFLKNEGANPSGCFKDRESVSCWLHAKGKNRKKAVIYSSGNAAASAAWLCQEEGIDLVAFVPGDTYGDKIDFIRDYGADVIKLGDRDTAFEEGYSLYAQLAASSYFFDNGYDDWSVRNPFRIEGDKTIAVEIVKQMTEAELYKNVPDFMIIPTANGSCLVGVWKGFNELKKASVIDKLPKMVSVGIRKGSPVYKAVRKNIENRPAIRSMDELDEQDEALGSIILAEEGYDSIEAASAIRDSDGLALELDSEDIKTVYENLIHQNKHLMNNHDLLPEPASALSIAAINKLVEDHDIDRNTSIVSLITGHGMKSKEKLEALLNDNEHIDDIIHPIIQRKRNKAPQPSEERGHLYHSKVNIDSIKEAFSKILHTQG